MEHLRDELTIAGFARLRQELRDADLDRVEQILDSLLLGRTGRFSPLRRELSEAAAREAPRHPEFSRPCLVAPSLKRSPVFKRCQDIASSVFRGPTYYLFDHAIYKMPRSGAVIPWHQDQAYLKDAPVVRSLHFWIPLQDTDAHSGCLRFAPGSHTTGVLPHARAFAQNSHVLRAMVGRLDSVDLPLRRGDISVHTNLTLHSSTPNDSDQIRKAWIIHFGDRRGWVKHLTRIAGSRWALRLASVLLR